MAQAPFPYERRVQRLSQAISSIVQFVTVVEGLAGTAQVRDLSVEGIGLLADQQLEPGTVLEIRFPGASAKEEHPLLAEVRHLAMQPDGSWLCGCVFCRKLRLDDLVNND